MKLSIDIGTTTIVIAAVQENAVSVIHTNKIEDSIIKETFLNQQRFFGADVISRIKASLEGSLEMLTSLIQTNLLTGIEDILRKTGTPPNLVTSITISANTTMVHLLLGYSCETLSAYPFEPVFLEKITLAFNEVFSNDLLDCPVTILPGISAFVGGDVLSGLYATDMQNQEKLTLFLDLGTNAEMALGNQDKILTTSAAAGPAFEGGNIKYGMAAIKGAIHQVRITFSGTKFKTIQYGRPIGLCGSGIIELTSELLEHHIIDNNGLLTEPYFSEGFPITLPNPAVETIRFFQSDIREVQMAKSAIRVGIKMLCNVYGCMESDIEKVYLAGAFGASTNLKKAASIGLIPSCFLDKTTLCGNTSLLGAIKYAIDENADDTIAKLKENTQILYLANQSDFDTEYISHLNF